jgi:hypothetical protein
MESEQTRGRNLVGFAWLVGSRLIVVGVMRPLDPSLP